MMRLSSLAASLALIALACSNEKAPERGAPPPYGPPPPVLPGSPPDRTPGDEAPAPAPTEAGADAGSSGPQACDLSGPAGAAASKWAAVQSGKLTYATLPKGERLLDFSYAGYMGGGVAIPDVAPARTVSPSGDDDTDAIQSAIDAVSKLPLVNGARGAVLLAKGTFKVSGPLAIHASGVVLRGSGSGTGGTTLQISGTPRAAIAVMGSGTWKTKGAAATITDAYVPSGARSFHVDDASGLAVGGAVLVERPVTDAWIHFMGMDALVRDGGAQTWLSNTTVIHSDRTVVALSGNTVTVDAPLSDSLDRTYLAPTGATVVPYTFSGRIEQVGVEALHLVSPKQTVPISDPIFSAIEMDAVQNGWVRDVATDEFMTGFVVDDGAKWITIEDSSLARTTPIDNSAGYPFQISIAGQQTLVQRCTTSGDDAFPYATQARTPGPNVVLGLVAKGSHTQVDPHQRWATGLLVDSAKGATELDLMNRGTDGSGHGWTIGFGVLWNSSGEGVLVQQPPGAQNWAIGTSGTLLHAPAPGSSDTTPLPDGIVDSPSKPVAPRSLYLAQLCLRLGPAALKNIGY